MPRYRGRRHPADAAGKKKKAPDDDCPASEASPRSVTDGAQVGGAASSRSEPPPPGLRRKGSGKGGVKLQRSRSWLLKAGGVAMLPCEEDLAELLEEYQACRQAGDQAGCDAAQIKLLTAHPFVQRQTQEVPAAALASGVSCRVENFKMNVRRFQQWLRTPQGRPFEERGKGWDDGCYLTSSVFRTFMPRGFTVFNFTSAASSETSIVILRGFLKFTGLTATDEDEESGATNEVDAFMFNGFSRSDASRFAVTTKSNGENGKYMVRSVFGDWYFFGGSKNTGKAWLLGADVSTLYPIPADTEDFADIPAKIVKQINDIATSFMEVDDAKAFRQEVDARRLTLMVESNDPDHEHIFPIERLHLEHVAILDSHGYPLPQRDAYAFFAKYRLESVAYTIHDSMEQLESAMHEIRSGTENEGAVIYLERDDGAAVGLVKVKSDHYVKARRTREIVRATLVARVSHGQAVEEALAATRKRLRSGMKDLKHVAGCNEQHDAWAEFAIAFAEDWARRYSASDEKARLQLVKEFGSKYGSLYRGFWERRSTVPRAS